MIDLIYASTATQMMSEAELIELLKKAREKNKSHNVTGMLLYNDGSFLQVLEGETDDVMALYETIRKDPRHRAVTTIAIRPTTVRTFPEWEMGFMNLHKIDPDDVPGFSDYLTTAFNSEQFVENPSFAHAFMQAFKSGVVR